MKQRALPIALLIAFLTMIWCGLLAPSHACCVVDSERMGAMESPEDSGMPTVAACCQTKALAFVSSDWHDHPEKLLISGAVAPLWLEWQNLSGQDRHVALHRQFIKDQSRRHLELSVLLN